MLIASLSIAHYYVISLPAKHHALVEIEQQELEMKQREVQHQLELEDEARRQEAYEDSIRSTCHESAEQSAIDLYASTCDGYYMECSEGRYLTKTYENGYAICLQSYGL